MYVQVHAGTRAYGTWLSASIRAVFRGSPRGQLADFARNNKSIPRIHVTKWGPERE